MTISLFHIFISRRTEEEYVSSGFKHTIIDSVVVALNYVRRGTADSPAYYVLSGRQSSVTAVQKNARIARIRGDRQKRFLDYVDLKCASKRINVILVVFHSAVFTSDC